VGAKQYHQEPSQLCPRHRPKDCSAYHVLTSSVTCSLKKTRGNVVPERGGCLLMSTSINPYKTLYLSILFPRARSDKIFSLLWRFPYMYCPYCVIQFGPGGGLQIRLGGSSHSSRKCDVTDSTSVTTSCNLVVLQLILALWFIIAGVITVYIITQNN